MFSGRTKCQAKTGMILLRSFSKKDSIESISLQTCVEKGSSSTDGYREKSSDRIIFMCFIEKVTAIGRVTAIGYRPAIGCDTYNLKSNLFFFFFYSKTARKTVFFFFFEQSHYCPFCLLHTSPNNLTLSEFIFREVQGLWKCPFGGNFRDHLTSLTSGACCGGLAEGFSSYSHPVLYL